MDNSRWGLGGEGFNHGNLKNAQGASGCGGWNGLNAAGAPPIGVRSRGIEGTGVPCVAPAGDSSDDSLEDAMSRFGRMSLGTPVPGVEQLSSTSNGCGRVDELGIAALRVKDAPAAQYLQTAGGMNSLAMVSSPSPAASAAVPSGGMVLQWGGHRCLSQQEQQVDHQQRSQQQQQQRRQEQLEVAPRAGAQGGGVVNHLGGGCPSCGGKGPDGVWRDEEGRRLYTEQEVREAVGQEGARWRERYAELEASRAKMEREAREALQRAEQALSEMTEQLRASEGKTYALSVHLARSNRPSHLA